MNERNALNRPGPSSGLRPLSPAGRREDLPAEALAKVGDTKWIVRFGGTPVHFVHNHCGNVYSLCHIDDATVFDTQLEAARASGTLPSVADQPRELAQVRREAVAA